jgi:hypothetical protein
MDLETLAVGLGCFPLDLGPSHPKSDSRTTSYGIRSLIGFGNLVGPLALSVLYLRKTYPRLYLNIFRGEPAITGFDWPFTPIHKSSKSFSTDTGSVLHKVLPLLQPAHG